MREHYIFVYVYNLRDYVLRRAVMLYTLNEWVNAYSLACVICIYIINIIYAYN